MATYQTGQAIVYVGNFSASMSGGTPTTYTVPAGHFVKLSAASLTESAGAGSGLVGTITASGVELLSITTNSAGVRTVHYEGGDASFGEGTAITLTPSTKFMTGAIRGTVFKNSP